LITVRCAQPQLARKGKPGNRPGRPGKSRRRILESPKRSSPVQGRIHIEKINEPFLFRDRGSPAEYSADLKLAIERGWLKMHDSGTYLKFTAAGADLIGL
jgi:hypothetical protein